MLVFLCTTETHAQVQKSDQNLGFGFDIRSLSGDGKQSNTNLFVTYTYYLSNRISIGLGPRFGWQTNSSSNQDATTGETTITTTKTSTIGYNAFLNYSFISENGFAMPYFGGQFLRFIQKQPNTDNIVMNSYGVNAGIKFFITERLNVDNNVSYTWVTQETKTINSGGIPIELDLEGTVLQINVGLGYIIGRKN